MKVKTLIPFVVILAILGGLVIWQKVNVKPAEPIATQIGLESLVPEGLQKDAVKKLELYAGEKPEEKVVLERDGDAWRVASLYNAPGNKETIDKFVNDLLGLKGEPRAKADSDETLASFALTDKEAFHIRAFKADEENPAMEVLFGKSADFKTVFLRKAGGDRVFVESVNLRRDAGVSDSGEGTTPKPEKWLQTKLLGLEDKVITKVALKYPDKELVLTREEVKREPAPTEGESEGEGETAPPPAPEVTYKWTLSQGGFNGTINEQEVKTLLTRFANVTVTNASDPARKSELGFDQPAFSVTLTKDDGSEVVLLGSKDKTAGDTYIQLVGAQPDLVYQISKFNFEQVFLQGGKLFTLPEWTVDKAALRNIAVAGPRGNVALAFADNAWKVTEPPLALETQKTALDNLVAAVSSLKPVDYADAGKDVGAFDTTVTATLEGGATRTLLIGQPSLAMDGRYVKFDNSDAVLVVSRADAEKLMPPVRDLFVLSVLDFEAEKVNQIHMSGQDADLLLTRGEGTSQWNGTYNGAAIVPDPAKVDELIFSLNDFQVDNFLLDRPVESVQAASTATITLQDGAQTVIKIGAEANGLHELTISGLPYVFTASVANMTGIVDKVVAFANMVPQEPAPAPTETGGVKVEQVGGAMPANTPTLPGAPEAAIPEMPVMVTPPDEPAADPAAPTAVVTPEPAPAEPSVVVTPPPAPEAAVVIPPAAPAAEAPAQ